VAKRVVELSAEGLKRRACLDSVGGDEGHFLEVLRLIADSGVTPAEEKLEAYHGRWQGKVDPVFTEFAY
jgi:glutamate--cysteine ligase